MQPAKFGPVGDRNAPVDLHFHVTLTTTATPENRHKVIERFNRELELQFGSAITVKEMKAAQIQVPIGGSSPDHAATTSRRDTH